MGFKLKCAGCGGGMRVMESLSVRPRGRFCPRCREVWEMGYEMGYEAAEKSDLEEQVEGRPCFDEASVMKRVAYFKRRACEYRRQFESSTQRLAVLEEQVRDHNWISEQVGSAQRVIELESALVECKREVDGYKRDRDRLVKVLQRIDTVIQKTKPLDLGSLHMGFPDD